VKVRAQWPPKPSYATATVTAKQICPDLPDWSATVRVRQHSLPCDPCECCVRERRITELDAVSHTGASPSGHCLVAKSNGT